MNRLYAFFRSSFVDIFRRIGFDYVGVAKHPKFALLGIKKYQIHTIIDVGANTGQFAKDILRIFPDAELYCFEPLPTVFHDLKEWSKSSKNDQVKVFNLALGDHDGMEEIYFHNEHSPSSSLLKTTKTTELLYPMTRKQKSITVPLRTIDNVLGEVLKDAHGNILIKVDVQGYEDRVICGGEKIFSKAKAVILELCLDRLYENQAGFKDIVLLMDDLGFHYAGNLEQIYADDGHVVFFDAVFIK